MFTPSKRWTDWVQWLDELSLLTLVRITDTLTVFQNVWGCYTQQEQRALTSGGTWSGIITPSAWTRSTTPLHTYHRKELVLLLNVTVSHPVRECTLLQWPHVGLQSQNVECVSLCSPASHLLFVCAFCTLFVTYKEAINRLLKRVTTCLHL